ncbi:hypothetical protein TcWFU_007052 [Taenia crassiceps]|uniref:Uncharacterized protein n=1 Tax=Taenia crassiceps TaxID=6207 RepID=A0ABR4QSN7_9CEST
MQCLEHIVSLSKSCRQVPWKDENVEALVSHLRVLRAVFVDSSKLDKPDVNQKDCAQILIALSSILSFLLNLECRNFLDQTEGQYHLVVSVLIQCLVNCLSHMAQHKMHVSGEVTATLIASLVYNATIRDWVFSLNLGNSLPLWRVRIGCYAFILITTLITSAQQSGIPSDFTTFLLLAVRAMKVISVNGGENVQLLQTWSDHCISLIGSLSTLPPSEEYWKHKIRGQERAIELCAALGTILLLHEYEEQSDGLEIPSMKKLADLCTASCLPRIKAPYELWVDMMISILGHCVSKSPFKLTHEEEYNVNLEPLSVALPDYDNQQMLAILRGGVYLTLNLLPPIQATDGTLQPVITTRDELTTLIFTIGDVLVIVDSLLQAHLATRATIGVGRKAPSLMDSMGTFSFAQPRSICFAKEIKQELIRSLLSMAFFAFRRFNSVEHLLFRGLRGLANARMATPPLKLLDNPRMRSLLDQPVEAALFTQILKFHPDFDNMIVKPLLEVAKLNIESVMDLIHLALSQDLQNFCLDSCSLDTRLMLLQPHFVISQVIRPLMRFGVKNPHRVIRRCPSLFAAAIMKEDEQTRLLIALSTLNMLLTRKDLNSLVKSYPSVLTRSREDLQTTHDYLTRVMGLEGSGEMVGSTVTPRSVHNTRHSTRLRLVACPAWHLPFRRTVARHLLLLLANQWPPSLSHSAQKSRDYIVAQLLTCSPEQFSYWLEYHDQPEERVEGRIFSAKDVRQFEKICNTLTLEEDSTADEEEEDFSDSNLDTSDSEP